METGRFPDWQPERTGSDSTEPRPESSKKSKRRRGEAGSERTRRTSETEESGSKEQGTAEHQRARKALADILVEPRTGAGEKAAERKRRGPAVPLDLFADGEKKAAADEHGNTVKERATAERPGRTDVGERGDADVAAEQSSVRSMAERPEEDAAEAGIPHPERDYLRPGEMYGGEFVLHLQDGKTPAEREIPLHETAAAAPKNAERDTDREPEPMLSIHHDAEPAADEELVPENAAEPLYEEAEPDPATEPGPQHQPGFEPFVPPVFPQAAEGPQPARAYETAQPEDFVSTAPAPGPEAFAAVAPEAGNPNAAVPAAPEAFAAVPGAGAARSPESANVYPTLMQQPAARVTSAEIPGEQMVTKQEADDAVYYATKAAQGRGLAAGVLVAALWARHRGKKLRRNFNSRFQQQDKEIKQLKEDQHWRDVEQARRQSESGRQLAAAEQRYATAEKQLANAPKAEATPTVLETLAGVQRNQPPQGAGQTVRSAPERFGTMPEQQPGQAPVYAKLTPEQVMQAAPIPEQLNIPPEHRLETSAWHTIEVDARTGRPVEQPAFAYGHEYYQERSHENAPASQRSVVAGEVALTGASAAGAQGGSGAGPSGGAGNGVAGAGGGSGSALPPNIPSATMQGTPQGDSTAKSSDARSPISKAASSGPVWPLVAALLIIFLFLIVLLH